MRHISKFLVIGMLAPTVVYATVDGKSMMGDTTAKIYGRINRIVNYTNDGQQKNWLFPDNDAAPTNLGAKIATKIDNYISGGAKLEVALQKGRGYRTNQLNRTGAENSITPAEGPTLEDNSSSLANLWYANAWLKHQTYGKLTVGRLNTPGEGSGEISMAGTYDIGNANVSYIAPGMFLHSQSSNQTVTTNDPRVTGNFSSIDGFDVGRKNAIMYTSPQLLDSITLAASFGNLDANRDYADASVWFKRCFSGVAVEAAAAAGKSSHGNRYQARKYADMSAGLLHKDSGWNLSGSWGKEKNDDTGTFVRTSANGSTKNHKVHYIQVGKRNDFFEVGSTNFAVDYYKGKDSTQDGDKSKSYGLVMEQHVDKLKGAVYAGIRKYDYQRVAVKFDKMTVVAVGIKVGFSAKTS